MTIEQKFENKDKDKDKENQRINGERDRKIRKRNK